MMSLSKGSSRLEVVFNHCV